MKTSCTYMYIYIKKVSSYPKQQLNIYMYKKMLKLSINKNYCSKLKALVRWWMSWI